MSLQQSTEAPAAMKQWNRHSNDAAVCMRCWSRQYQCCQPGGMPGQGACAPPPPLPCLCLKPFSLIQGAFLWMRPAPYSLYSALDIHICWKVPREARMLPPIHTLYRRSAWPAGHTTCVGVGSGGVGKVLGAGEGFAGRMLLLACAGTNTMLAPSPACSTARRTHLDLGHLRRQVSHLLLQPVAQRGEARSAAGEHDAAVQLPPDVHVAPAGAEGAAEAGCGGLGWGG